MAVVAAVPEEDNLSFANMILHSLHSLARSPFNVQMKVRNPQNGTKYRDRIWNFFPPYHVRTAHPWFPRILTAATDLASTLNHKQILV